MLRSKKDYKVSSARHPPGVSSASEQVDAAKQNGGLYYTAGCYTNPSYRSSDEEDRSSGASDTGQPPTEASEQLGVSLSEISASASQQTEETNVESIHSENVNKNSQSAPQVSIISRRGSQSAAISSQPQSSSSAAVATPSASSYSPAGEHQTCGCGPWKPQCLQACARPAVYLMCVSALVLCNSLLVAGYLSSILTTIEKRYELWSRELGLIISSYDFTAMLAGLTISYLGDRYNRAKWLGRGALVVASGTIIFSLPYFIGGQYVIGKSANMTEQDMYLCNATHTSNPHSSKDCDAKNPDTWALALFMIGQMIIGAGAAPIFTLGVTYLYDNVAPSRYSIYAGIMFSMTALGPASGFLLGAVFLGIYVHPSSPPTGVTSEDKNWVGAWWAGILMCTAMYIMVALPLLLFPKELPNVRRDRSEDQDEEDRPMVGFGKNLKEFPKHAKKLLTNPTWLFVSLMLVMEQSIGTGFNRYIAKYLEVSYNIASSKANIITGAVIIPGACIGFITGGVLMKKMRLSVPGIAKFLLVMNLIPTIAVAALLLLGCDTVDLVGINTAYTLDIDMEQVPLDKIMDELEANFKDNLTAACNSRCACSHELYQPVCGRNNLTYFSPCHAGCTVLQTYSDESGLLVKNYSSCACVYEDFVHRTAVATVATSGKCDHGCYNLIVFLIILFIIVFITCCGQNPVLLITLKCVGSDSRSFALGMQNFLIQLIAFIPAPIYFGRIFDSLCILWSESCDREGACLEYNIKNLPFALFGTCLAFKVLTSLFIVLVWYFTSKEMKFKKKKKNAASASDVTMATNSMSESGIDATMDAAISTISGNYVPQTEVTRL